MSGSDEQILQSIVYEALAETILLPDPKDQGALRAIWVHMHERIQATVDLELAKRFVELTESEQDLITRDHFPFTEFIGIVRSAL